MFGVEKDGFRFWSVIWPFNKRDAICVLYNRNSLDEYERYINENQLEQAYIVMPDLHILEQCPSLKYLNIYLPHEIEKFDFSPLYRHPEVKILNCGNFYGLMENQYADMDFSRINGLVELSFGYNKATIGYDNVNTLKSLSVGGYKGKYMRGNDNIDPWRRLE